MARGKRSVPALPLSQEIQRQGVVSMMQRTDVPGSDTLHQEFVDWMRKCEPIGFDQLVHKFALHKIEQVDDREL